MLLRLNLSVYSCGKNLIFSVTRKAGKKAKRFREFTVLLPAVSCFSHPKPYHGSALYGSCAIVAFLKQQRFLLFFLTLRRLRAVSAVYSAFGSAATAVLASCVSVIAPLSLSLSISLSLSFSFFLSLSLSLSIALSLSLSIALSLYRSRNGRLPRQG
jgi:hypothetical protein